MIRDGQQSGRQYLLHIYSIYNEHATYVKNLYFIIGNKWIMPNKSKSGNINIFMNTESKSTRKDNYKS